ncbi:MAG: helix-turn-helix domain-containing protein [Clostridia bacterium]|nr:helix-turn-helix domain-containing protein [Clostridia bacterium]
MLSGYMNIREAAEKWNVSPRHIQAYCASGRIKGAKKFSNVWFIPVKAEKPADARVTTGEYRNWRKSAAKMANVCEG